MIQRDTKPPGKSAIGFLESKIDIVRAAAAASTKRYRDGKPLGPLDGVPVAVKDEVHLKGYKRTLGSKLDFSHGFDETSWCVEKWEEAGAVVIGKTTMHEIGIGEYQNVRLVVERKANGFRYDKQQPQYGHSSQPL